MEKHKFGERGYNVPPPHCNSFYNEGTDYTFFGEFMRNNHHNTIKYEREPQNNFVLFDVMVDGEIVPDSPIGCILISQIFECEPVNVLKHSETIPTSAMCEEIIRNNKSSLGGNMEGVVIKNYSAVVEHYGNLFPFFFKYVLDEFKEMNRENWKSISSGKGDIMESVKGLFNEDAIFHKVLFHVKDAGGIGGSMKDIPALVNSLKPGILPNHRELNPNNALSNVLLGTDIAEKDLEIPKGNILYHFFLS